ncbi:MAG: hypothetical protein NVS1B4_09840 [Gemmatimonadaceae bacterium]
MADVVAAPGVMARTVAAVQGTPAFYRSVVKEMKNVTWPDRPQVVQATWLSILIVLILGAVIALMDVALQGILVRLLPSLFAGR